MLRKTSLRVAASREATDDILIDLKHSSHKTYTAPMAKMWWCFSKKLKSTPNAEQNVYRTMWACDFINRYIYIYTLHAW